MGSSGSQTAAQSQRHTMSLLWRLFAVLLVLNSCHVSLINAKQISSLDENDKLFFAPEDESPLSVSSLQSKIPLIEDNPDDTGATGFWNAGVSRVRRELSRFFGTNDAHHQRQKRQKRPANKKRSVKRQNRALQKKRASEDYEDGSGIAELETAFYRTRFTVAEPYQNEFNDKDSKQFLNLSKEIEMGLRELFRRNYEGDDDDADLHSTLLQVGPTDDNFHSYVIVNLAIPSNFPDFEYELRKQLENYHLIGKQSASMDNDFYFRAIQDINAPEPTESVDEDGSGDPEPVPEPTPECRGDSTYYCYNSNTRVCDEMKCDGKNDCPNGEDEEDCPSSLVCTEEEFRCDNRCLDRSMRCDGVIQCQDQTDEAGCTDNDNDNDNNNDNDNDNDNGNGNGDDDDQRQPEPEPEQTDEGHESEGDHKSDFDSETNTDQATANECHPNQFKCRSGLCIDSNRRCNYVPDCPDGDDEGDDCPAACSGMEYQCRDGTRCISESQQCDGHADCSDADDEENCDGSGYDADQCQYNEFRCGNGECIPMRQVCDNIYDCNDYTDEQHCDLNDIHDTVDQDGIIRNYADHSRRRRPPPKIGRNDNDNNNDNNNNIHVADIHEEDALEYQIYLPHDQYEKSSPLNPCASNQFKCRNNVCIPLHLRCDGFHHCNDMSDEDNCDRYRPPQTTRRPMARPTPPVTSRPLPWPTPAPDSLQRRTTEAPPTVATPRTTTSTRLTTTNPIPITPTGGAAIEICRSNEIACNGRCVDNSIRCDGRIDCDDGSDEYNCRAGNKRKHKLKKVCKSNEWQCENSECIDSRYVCDEHYDCQDKSDEWPDACKGQATTRQNAEDCRMDQFYCDNLCLNRSKKCDGHYDCTDRSDERDCPMQATRHPAYGHLPCPEHTCPSSGRCYTETERCDGQRHCEDNSDEANCCAPDQFRCRNGDCVASDAVCNGYPQCMDGSDEIDCNQMSCQANQFRCRNGQCVSAAVRCNGQTDCQDSSDELNCATGQETSGRNQLNLKTYPNSQTIKESREVIFRCRDEGPARAKVRWTRPGGRPLPVGFTDKNGRLEIPNIRLEDSGTYVCEALGYPNYIPGQQVTVHLTVERFNVVDHDRPPTACSEYQATCMNGECIDKSNICDGLPHCSDGSDEHSCSQGRRCQPNQFLCGNSKCVERTWRCDGENDCGDNSDEESCDPEPSGAPCRYNEFQCSSGHCIPKSFQCDDLNDCRDGSDEIGCMEPVPIRPPPPMQSLLEGQSLNLTCTATGVPIPTIVWRLNWGHVPDKCVSRSNGGRGELYCPDMHLEDSGAYSCEIINTRGTHFVTPDTIVKVTPDRNQFCSAGFFNMLARSSEECIKCFCFGVATSCDSANLYMYAIHPPIQAHRVVSVELSPYHQIVINDSPGHNLLNMQHGVQFRASDVQYNSRETPYLALPGDYMGNQLKSYGGKLKYDVSYVGNGRPISGPDVIITGNGFTLTNRVRTQPNLSNKVSVSFLPGNWQKPDGRKATREEIMMILANVDNILIRLGYIDTVAREVELINIVMDSAGTSDQGLGSASLVEKCNCPPGYVGDSCEKCAPGYVRQPGGPWLGHCVPFVAEPCPPGTYGDPRRGISCTECPCPHSGSNNFASGCVLNPDGDVSCKCHEGYEGRRCESCAAGYQGNPLVPGGSCRRIPESTCNVEGTYNQLADNSCHCKSMVIGEHCDTCAPKSFHLNSFTYTGCIECFCSALQAECTSTSWYRDQVSSSFGRSRAPHGFQLIRDYTQQIPQSVPFNTMLNELQFNTNTDYSSDTLYWSLPAAFLGNKLTAYGGRLNYTLSYSSLPGGQMSRNSAPDVVIKSGEDLTLIHNRKHAVSPSQSSSYAVPIIESAWQRIDGVVILREHLLMALSKIDAIYIKATYTTSTKEGALKHVVMDVATPTNLGTSRAYEVEECRCPQGYIGLSCERCAPGYKRNPEEGLYLGLCEPCECNGHSSQCDGETGECLNCADNTEGETCDRCAAGYVGDATRGTPYDCQPDNNGPQPPQPPQPDNGNQVRCHWCNSAGTESCDNGVCNCKPNVVGNRCDQCRQGTFGLAIGHDNGCKECFCSGQATQCQSAKLYRQLIPVDFISNQALITDEDGQEMDRENLSVDIRNNKYTYTYLSYLPKYWSLRGNVEGNKLAAYGGRLNYTLNTKHIGGYQPGSDVIIIGNGIRLIWSRPEEGSESYSVILSEDDQWQRMDRGRTAPASRNDIMSVLTNIEHLLIRATPHIPTTETSIRDVSLEVSYDVAQPGAEQVVDIELCQCPTGYVGNSCESCAPNYYRDENNQCSSCPCHRENSVGCTLGVSGNVECECKSQYTGERCTDPKNNIEEPTPIDPPDNIRTQIIVSISKPKITIMPVGGSISLTCSGRMRWNNDPVFVSWYRQNSRLPMNAEIQGGVLHINNLQITDSGVYICQAINNQTSHTFEDMVSITVSHQSQRSPAQIINLPSTVTFDEYQPNEISCEVEGNPTPTVTWTRVDGQADGHTRTDGGRLIFESPRKSDEGRYRCAAQNQFNTDEKYVQIYVRGNAPPPTRERLYIQPEYYNGEVGETVRLTCQSTSGALLQYEWLHDNYPLNPQQQRNVIISGDTLEIRDASARDSGIYTCVGIDPRSRRNYTEDARVYIEQRQQPPSGDGIAPVIVHFNMENSVNQGADFSITCESSGSPYPNIKWIKVNSQLPSNVHQTGNVLRIINAKPENRGSYLCIAENSAGSDQKSTNIDVEPREAPSVKITVASKGPNPVGAETWLYCIGSGIPEPIVQWRRVDGTPLSPRHDIQADLPGYLIIHDMQIVDAGDYECVGTSELGRASDIANVRVVEAPVITLNPDQSTLRLTEGDELSVACTASGYPNPSVQWENNPSETNFGDNTAYLEIYRIGQHNAGTYTCVATNEAGRDERQLQIEVQPRRGDIAEPDGDVDVDEQRFETNLGENVNITCDLANENTNTRWDRLDNKTFEPNTFAEGNKMTIISVSESNLGRYRCSAYNNRGIFVASLDRELVLSPLPQITFIPQIPYVAESDESVTIYCNVTNVRPENVQWSTGDRPLPNNLRINGPYLHFESITPANAGIYTCSAWNQHGHVKNNAQVVVHRPNRYEQQPQSQVQNGYEGQSIQLRCSVSSSRGGQYDDQIQFQWQREDGQPLPNGARPNSQELILPSLRLEDAGRYICNSFNFEKKQHLPQTYVDLRVLTGLATTPAPYPGVYLPPVRTTPEPMIPRDYSLKLDQQSSRLHVGESTEVECYSSDNSYTNVIWERSDGAPLSSNVQQVGNRLVINQVTAADAGNYVCKCRTDEGDLYTTSYELEIEEQPHELLRPNIVHAQVGDAAQLNCDAIELHRPSYRWSRQYGQLQPGRDILNNQLMLDDVQANDAGTYICTATYEDGTSLDYPTILVVTGAIPHFHQQPLSYMSFPTLANSSFKFNFEITFRPEAGNGLLLFNGQTRGTGDYIALSLVDRYAEFRFDFGGKPLVVRAEQPLELNEWHTMRVHRSRHDGYIQLDEQHPVAFPTLTQTPSLELVEDLYIGGVPSWDQLPANAVTMKTGFIGCISRLALQGRTVELMKEAKFKEGVTSCKPCKDSPCSNGGICLESQTELAYTCVCQQGWTGRNCAVAGAQCTPGICGAGRCENTELDMECLCPLNRTGDRCQYIEHLNEHSLNFKRNSYAAYGTPRVTRINVTLSVRPSSLRDAVILYTAESKLPSGDYVALVLRDGHVELMINTAARLKPVVARSLNPLKLHKWTRIELLRRQGESILRVGDEPGQHAKAAGGPRVLSLKTPLYVGGYDRASVKINRDVNITEGFDGCISRLYDSKTSINLLSDIVDAANVQNCGELNEIGDSDNDGDLLVSSVPDHHQQGHGSDEEANQKYENAPCANDPCENGGTCSELNNRAVCSCNLGYSGKHCQDHIQVNFNASFRGNGYLELDRNQFSTDIDQDYTSAVVVFSTSKPNGLLLWWGQKAGEEFTGQDFIALAVVDGFVEYAMRLDGEETVIRNVDTPVDDGNRHIVIVKRSENTAILELDRISDSGDTRPTSRKEMHLPGNVFIGGVPDISQFTGKRYMHNFNGCIVFVEGDAAGQINLGKSSINGANVDTCPVNDEYLGGTEPPVV